MNESLIIDVGMHTGRDTEFYLKKGFKVVAIEANPELVELGRSRFKDAISEKRLVIHDIAIADYEGEIDFYINEQKDDWGTISKEYAERNESLGTNHRKTHVRCTTFSNIIKEHGIPYYIKIDIEGADMLCLEALMDFKWRAKYISAELGLGSFEDTFTELSLLWNLGYRKFKIVNQAKNNLIECPNPPLEGAYVDYKFDGTCSGPFGEEAGGEWITIEEVLKRYRKLLTADKYFGATGRFFRTPIHKLYESISGEPVGWYDLHAKIGDDYEG